MKKTLFIVILTVFFPITLILYLHFGIIVSAEILRINKPITQIFDPNKCYGRSCLKGYEKYDWANKLFYEFANNPYEFSGYTLYKKKNYKGEFLNIYTNDNIRLTKDPIKLKNDLNAYIFGGSAAWGFGTKDDLTFASLFSNKFGIKTYNYAQGAWDSSQNLIELTRLISRNKKLDIVIFFEGFNDAVSLCRKDQNENFFNSSYVKTYNEKIYKKIDPASLENFFSVFHKLVTVIKYRLIKNYHEKRVYAQSDSQYDCHLDSIKNKKAAEYMINNWLQAKNLVESRGGKFYVILQPAPFFDNTKMDHIIELHNIVNRDKSFSESFISFYQLVSDNLKKEIFFLDLKGIFENKYDYIHIDYSGHFYPEGYNDIIIAFENKYRDEF